VDDLAHRRNRSWSCSKADPPAERKNAKSVAARRSRAYAAVLGHPFTIIAMNSLFRRYPLAVLTLCSGLALTGSSAWSATAAAPPTAPAPLPPTSFDAVTARLDKGGPFYVYLSTAQWLSDLSLKIIEWRDLALPAASAAPAADRENMSQAFALAAEFVKKSGVEQITGVGASSVEVEPGVYRNSLFVHHEKGGETGLLNTLFGTAPHPLTDLDLLPADTAAANFSDVDLAGLLSGVRATLNQSGIPSARKAVADAQQRFSAFAGMSLDNFLRSLSGTTGMILTLDPAKPLQIPLGPGQTQTIPTPRLALLLGMKDERVFDRIQEMVGIFPMVETVSEPGVRMLTAAFPVLGQVTVRFTVASWHNYLIVSSDDHLVRDIIAAQKTGQGFKASPVFAKLAQGLPTEGNGFSVVTQTFVDAMRHFQTGMFEHQPNVSPGQTQLLQRMFAAQSAGPSYSVASHLDDGWLTVAKGPQSLSKVALLPLMIVPAAIAGGMIMPAINAGRTAAPAINPDAKVKGTKAMAGAMTISRACQAYAGDHAGDFPPSLEALVPAYLPDKSLLSSPLAPKEPSGYTYTPGLRTSAAPGKVLLEDKFAPAVLSKRVVVHVDGSAVLTPP
jgi:hypothetical protein